MNIIVSLIIPCICGAIVGRNLAKEDYYTVALGVVAWALSILYAIFGVN